MDINRIREGNELTFFITGSIDSNTAPEVEQVILDQLLGNENLVLDLKDVSYVSSSGLRLFLILYKRMVEHGSFRLRNVNDFIREILEMTSFDTILRIE